MSDDIVDAPAAVTFYVHIIERNDSAPFTGWEWAVTTQKELSPYWKAHLSLGNWGYGATKRAALRKGKRRARALAARQSLPLKEREPQYERYVFTKEIV